MSEKLHKILARNGYGSRREMERWIEDGRLVINGKEARTADRVEERDKISLDGNLIELNFDDQQHRVLIYNKPEGEICTRDDPDGRKDVFANLPKLQGSRWIIVGRLDINTSGLLFFTTDGELANALMHPSSEIDREYSARILGEVDGQVLQNLEKGVELEDGFARFNSITDVGGKGANHWYSVVLKEGRKREVRRLWESQGVKVSRLMRTRFGPIALTRGLRKGSFRDLDKAEGDALYSAVGMKNRIGVRQSTSNTEKKTSHAKRSQQRHRRNPRKK